ncbi:hypothetical protein V6N13_101228 [Hibiscus sabdariffa]
MGAVNISWYSKRDTTSIEFSVYSFQQEQVLYLQPSMREEFRLQPSMGANLQSLTFNGSQVPFSNFHGSNGNLLGKSYERGLAFITALCQGGPKSRHHDDKCFQSPAFYGSQFPNLQPSTGENFKVLAFYGNQSLGSSFLREPIFSLQLSQGVKSTSPTFYGRKFQSPACDRALSLFNSRLPAFYRSKEVAEEWHR